VAQAIGTTISHDRIVDKLGGGGMGVVYEAEDTLKFFARGIRERSGTGTLSTRSRGRFRSRSP
jgi:hypothetical protein